MRDPDNAVPFFSGFRLQSSFLGLDEKDLSGYRYGSSHLNSLYFDNLDQKLYYWTSSKHYPLTPLHQYMVYSISDFFESRFIRCRVINPFASVSRSYSRSVSLINRSDLLVYLPSPFLVECETSFKHDYSDLRSRLRLYSKSNLFTYVVVPNLDLKKYYKSNLPKFHGRLYSIKEFFASF